MKTICLDLRALQIGHQNRGIGMHIRSLLENMPKDDNKYLFYCFDKSDPIASLGIKTKVKYELVQTPTIRTALDSPKNILGIIKLINHQFTPLKSKKPDVFVQFDFTLGFPRWHQTKTVVVGYDLIPLIMENEYMPRASFAWNHAKNRFRGTLRAIYYRFRYKLHYRIYNRADQVVCISKDAASAFVNLLGVEQKRITIIPLAPVQSDSIIDSSVAKKIPQPYIFYIGGTDSRKRISDLVHAYNIARGRGIDAQLVLAGNEFRSINKMTDPLGKEAILRSPYKDDILLVGFVTDAQKMGLYHAAHAFVSTSAYEGFGLPIIEAMLASCPVVAYNNSSIPEAAGDAAILVKTGDFVEVANQLIALQDKTMRTELIHAGSQQAAKFTWQTHVSAFRNVLLG